MYGLTVCTLKLFKCFKNKIWPISNEVSNNMKKIKTN